MTEQQSEDKVFDKQLDRVEDFAFDKTVADVFDDMVSRSVPSYAEIQRMLVELAASFATENTNIFDLGCSTGTTLTALHDALRVKAELHGMDYSAQMLDRCRAKLKAHGLAEQVILDRADFNHGVNITNASVVSMVLTLMFVRPMNRSRLIADIYNGLNENGCLLLVEKVLADGLCNRLFIDHYYEYKRRMGYSELEISQKREALENVLIPYTLRENQDLLCEAGFRTVEVFFKWYNFSGVVAVK